nr:histidine phosphatase family protein [Ruminococcus sp. OA3]
MRHGSIRLPDEEKCYIGQTDRSMTQEGQTEVDKSLERLGGQIGWVDEIWSSDLKRCVETAERAAMHFEMPFRTDQRLREINLGDWEGQSVRLIRQEYPKEYRIRGEHPGNYRTPGGENFLQVMIRAVQFTQERVQCLQEEKVFLFITHAGVIRTLCCCRDGRNPDELLQYQIGYGEYVVWDATKAAVMERLKDQSYH